ncbi:MAG: small, acid-soluble spore protein, alpha/beta type [Clostridiaceae bacterium]|nr:small, acid-soluble spore protein, alpha/beta type [Clostridiaceae bacterium]
MNFCNKTILKEGDIMKAKKTTKKQIVLTPEDAMKYEIANELGLGEKLSQVGWGGLTAEETGRIGGLITRKKRRMSG